MQGCINLSIKTNAVRIVESAGKEYTLTSYDCKDFSDAVSVAEKIGADVQRVYKTLVTQGKSGEYYVFVLPGCRELDLKKAAQAVGEKSVSMIHVKDINKITGYIRGGCSPLGMKKSYVTVIDSSAGAFEKIYVSAGKIGFQMEICPQDLCELVNGKFCDVVSLQK